MKLNKIIALFVILEIINISYAAEKNPQTLSAQAMPQVGKQVLDLYKQNPGQLQHYLAKLPWDMQLSVFDALITSLPAVPAYDISKNEMVLNSDIITNPEILIRNSETRSWVVRLLFDLLQYPGLDSTQKTDIANLLFTREAHLFPGSTAIVKTFEAKQFDKLKELLKYASLNIRLSSVAFYILSQIYKSYHINRGRPFHTRVFFSFSYPIYKLIRYSGLLDNTFVSFRYPLIHQIDNWINTKQIPYISMSELSSESTYTPSYIPLPNIALEELNEVRELLLKPYPVLKSCAVQ